jgi:hypothetical protein
MMTSSDLERHDEHPGEPWLPLISERVARLICIAAAWLLGGVVLIASAHLLRTLVRFMFTR